MRMTLGIELLMDTTLNLKQTDPQHVLVTRTDEELAHAYEQITRADEQIARADEQLSKLEHEAAGYPSDHRQTRMNKLRAAVPGNRPSLGGRAVRGFTGLMLAAGVCVAAIVWQSSYGDAAKQIIARWAPQFVPDFIAAARTPGAFRAAEPTYRSGGRGEDSTSTTSNLWLRPHRKTSRRPPPPCRPS
jgi:hypothetical protein